MVITNAGDGSGRLFVVEQPGLVRIVKGGELLVRPFLDIRDRVNFTGYDQGMLGLAFPPGYENNGNFYAGYVNAAGDTVVSRFHVTGDPDVADPHSEEILIVFEQPYAVSIHNGGRLAFGPRDGYLYIANGDGGYNKPGEADPDNHAQDPMSLLGKILRIDVESGAIPYGIPPTNPFVNRSGYRPEIWALGFRNPWHFSFDRESGDLYIGDVGNSEREEIDYQPGSSGGGENYGWRIMEGSTCETPPDGCVPPDGYVPPVTEYLHAYGNCAVIGGAVYRGSEYPLLRGIYLFGDWCSGNIWGLKQEGGEWNTALLHQASFGISTFGRDEEGRVYVSDFNGGTLYRLTTSGLLTPSPTATPILPTMTPPPLTPTATVTPGGPPIPWLHLPLIL